MEAVTVSSGTSATQPDHGDWKFQADALHARYLTVRRLSSRLCEPLAAEDYVIQSMPEASPVKWHLAHTSWFFETFVLAPFLPDYRPFHPYYQFLFNSYYEAVGPRWARPRRGLLSRPTVSEIGNYRSWVDQEVARLLERADRELMRRVEPILTLGLHHEQQHQELILTDLKHAWSANPICPVYRAPELLNPPPIEPARWLHFSSRLAWVGHRSGGFAFDNESPRHRVFLEDFELGSRLVTVGDYLNFIHDDGYHRPELWLSDGWATCQSHGWEAPLYWSRADGRADNKDTREDNQWMAFTLGGRLPLALGEPVCHLSYYEADAYARWAGARLPSEMEWECAAEPTPLAGSFLESEHFHPSAAVAPEDRGPLQQLHGEVWQWTASPYVAYPGYRPIAGALGEYNGKFMCNQMVLRGSSCVTARSHARHTYRNFFPAEARWQFSGLRLARDCA
jgi:ergothioneine biosynthesis protein EgtB